jgi:hypothetical protein
MLLGLGAACLQGSWALRANLQNGMTAALHAAATQACVSFMLTMAQVMILEALFPLGRTPAEGFVLAVVGMSGLGAGFAATGHAIAGTPHILATIAPSICLGCTFNVIYARGLFVAATRALTSAEPQPFATETSAAA